RNQRGPLAGENALMARVMTPGRTSAAPRSRAEGWIKRHLRRAQRSLHELDGAVGHRDPAKVPSEAQEGSGVPFVLRCAARFCMTRGITYGKPTRMASTSGSIWPTSQKSNTDARST